jgi:light-regulated signal transduction histidine kinase (bacteriophytochrome)
VDEVVSDLQRQHPGRVIDWRIAPDLPSVLADTALLRLSLQQVLGNAIKFSAPRDVAVIEISADRLPDPAMATLQVQDNGVGYNPAQQGALFKVFGRLHNGKQFDGLGMGLVLAAHALQRMGGTVTAQGVVDGGCCVRLQLPCG